MFYKPVLNKKSCYQQQWYPDKFYKQAVNQLNCCQNLAIMAQKQISKSALNLQRCSQNQSFTRSAILKLTSTQLSWFPNQSSTNKVVSIELKKMRRLYSIASICRDSSKMVCCYVFGSKKSYFGQTISRKPCLDTRSDVKEEMLEQPSNMPCKMPRHKMA